MSANTLSRRRNPYDSLEKILNKTTLTTQRVTHGNIIDVGDDLLKRARVTASDEKEIAVAVALQEARRRHEQEMKLALHAQQQQAEQEKQIELSAVKKQYEQMAAAAAAAHQREVRQKLDSLQRQWEQKLQAALQSQQDHFDSQREQIIEEATSDLRKKLRAEFTLAKEQEIAAALKTARDGFKIKEKEVIERTRCECETAARLEREKLQEAHDEELDKLQSQFDTLMNDYTSEMEYRQMVEQDFKDCSIELFLSCNVDFDSRTYLPDEVPVKVLEMNSNSEFCVEELQADYKRFLDNTRGRFHSDYMMRLRPYGALDSANLTDLPDLPNKTALLSCSKSTPFFLRPVTK